MGVLIRSAEALETTGKINSVVLDKTGPITEGKPSLTDVLPLGKWRDDPGGLLSLTAAAEHDSEHPLAAAIVAGAQKRGIPIGEVTAFHAIAGQGVTADITVSSRWLAASAKRDDSVVLPNADVRETHAVAVLSLIHI